MTHQPMVFKADFPPSADAVSGSEGVEYEPQTLAEFVRDVHLPDDGSITFRGRVVAPPADRLSQDALSAVVYQYLYSHPDGNGAGAFVPGTPDPALIAGLADANQVQDFHQDGWTVQLKLDSGAVLAHRQGMVRKFMPGQFVCAPGHFPMRVGSQITAVHHKGTANAQPGFYHVFGADTFDMAEALYLVRFYFNVRPEAAVDFTRVLTGALDRYRIPFNFKIATRLADFSRVDTAVLYVPQRVFTSLVHVLGTIMSQLNPMLDPGTPFFTRAVVPGIGFAEEPAGHGSFGSNRSEMVARAMIAAADGNRVCPDRFQMTFDDSVERDGFDPGALHLRPQSKFDYSAVRLLAPVTQGGAA